MNLRCVKHTKSRVIVCRELKQIDVHLGVRRALFTFSKMSAARRGASSTPLSPEEGLELEDCVAQNTRFFRAIHDRSVTIKSGCNR
jgi:hypothetical protein